MRIEEYLFRILTVSLFAIAGVAVLSYSIAELIKFIKKLR